MRKEPELLKPEALEAGGENGRAARRRRLGGWRCGGEGKARREGGEIRQVGANLIWLVTGLSWPL